MLVGCSRSLVCSNTHSNHISVPWKLLAEYDVTPKKYFSGFRIVPELNRIQVQQISIVQPIEGIPTSASITCPRSKRKAVPSWVCTLRTVPVASRSRRKDVFCFAGSEHEIIVLLKVQQLVLARVHLCLYNPSQRATPFLRGFVDGEQRFQWVTKETA